MPVTRPRDGCRSETAEPDERHLRRAPLRGCQDSAIWASPTSPSRGVALGSSPWRRVSVARDVHVPRIRRCPVRERVKNGDCSGP
jgi:hypothetical protein